MAINSGVSRLQKAEMYESGDKADSKPSGPKTRRHDITLLAEASNIDKLLTKEESKLIARQVIEGYREDCRSRKKWEEQMKQGNKLALQIMETKSFPWPEASNVKFPLLTVSTLQFSARAYPALVKGPEVVKCRTIGEDPMGEKRARANRIAQHMSYQILEQDEGWEEDHDKLTMVLPISGTAFKKSYYSATDGHNKSELVLAQDLIVNYYAKSLEDCDRKTHRFCMYHRDIRERELDDLYTEYDHGDPNPDVDKEGDDDITASDERQGLKESFTDPKKPYTMLEQHMYWDLDGDGYEEPYVATVCLDSGKLVRLVNRFRRVHTEQDRRIQAVKRRMGPLVQQANMLAQGQQEVPEALREQIEDLQQEIQSIKAEKPTVLKIDAMEFFTKYGFIPSPDGGFYDLGFGALLGPINESVNTLINQLIDSGTMQNGSTGFLGRGARIKGGEVRFRPYEWKRVDVAGSTLRDSIVPLPVAQPSAVLFNLLGMLVSYGERIASVTDMMVGDNPGQNTPAYNAQQMLQQGMAVFTGIFKRIHRSMRDEFRKLYILNSLHLDEQEYFQILDGPTQDVFKIDYMGDPNDVKPAADSNAILSEEKLRQAGIMAERAQIIPGYDLTQVELRFLEAMGIQDVQEVYPLQENPQTGQVEIAIKPPPNPEFEIKRAEEQRRTLEAQNRDDNNRAETGIKGMLAVGQLAEMEARTVKILAEAGGIEESQSLEQQRLLLDKIKEQREGVLGLINAENDREKIRQERARAMADKSGDGRGAGST